MTCAGHFKRDCPDLDEYKFYLAFENSLCSEYITEKVLWNAYAKVDLSTILTLMTPAIQDIDGSPLREQSPLALFNISISNIDCQYINTFEKYRYQYGHF